MSKDIRVLLYYKYIPIENAEAYAAEHLAFCKSIGLKGRILIADEGINGTVSGDYETTQKYMDYVHANPLFSDFENFKKRILIALNSEKGWGEPFSAYLLKTKKR
jgi:predicted sulfurtransferase